MRFWKSNKGMVIPFKIVQGDGTTAKNLTGITVKLYLKDRDGTQPTGSPVTATVTDAANGLITVTIPANLLDTVKGYTAQFNLSDGASYEEDTEQFQIDVDDRLKP